MNETSDRCRWRLALFKAAKSHRTTWRVSPVQLPWARNLAPFVNSTNQKRPGFPALQNMDTNKIRNLLKRSQWLHEFAKRVRSDLGAAGGDSNREAWEAATEVKHSTFELQERLQFMLAESERNAASDAPCSLHSLSGKACSACGDLDGCHVAEKILHGGVA